MTNDPGHDPNATTDRRLAVVVLTWNDREQTLDCLDHLQRELAPGDRLFVADNGSTDGTEAAVRARHPTACYVQNGGNRGFAGGNNTALRAALDQGYRWILLWNNDAVPEQGALRTLLAHAERSPGLVAAQPLLLDRDDPSRIDSLGIEVRWWLSVRDRGRGAPRSSAPPAPTPVFGACGAAALLRAAALRATGLLDEDLFILLEDVDLMFRLRLLGQQVELVPAAAALHTRRISRADRASPQARRRRFWLQRNMVVLALRYWPVAAVLLCTPLLSWRMLVALWLHHHVADQPCAALWRAALRQRRGHRARMRRLGLDHWFVRTDDSATVAP